MDSLILARPKTGCRSETRETARTKTLSPEFNAGVAGVEPLG
jgi:hypothetical protein